LIWEYILCVMLLILSITQPTNYPGDSKQIGSSAMWCFFVTWFMVCPFATLVTSCFTTCKVITTWKHQYHGVGIINWGSYLLIQVNEQMKYIPVKLSFVWTHKNDALNCFIAYFISIIIAFYLLWNTVRGTALKSASFNGIPTVLTRLHALVPRIPCVHSFHM